MLLTPGETKALIEGVWTGQYSSEKLPPWLFDRLADGYQGAAVRGWGNVLGSGAIKDQALELAIQENVFFFAAHKTAQQLKDMNQILIASTGKYDFVKRALQVNDKYNNTWYNTEYGVTKRIARAGRDWKRIEATADIYPRLKFIAVQDANTRKAHASLHGIIRPVEDAFWKTYYPPLDWSCRCRVERLLPNTGATTPLPPAKDLPTVIEQFKERVTDSRRIWAADHPYFTAPLTPTVKKTIKKMVAQKIIKEKPYQYAGPSQTAQELTAKHPGVSFEIGLSKQDYDSNFKGFNIPRLIDNLAESFKTTTADGVISPSQMKRVKLLMNYDRVTIRIEGKNSGEDILIIRDFFKSQSGRSTVDHHYFQIPESIQGGGFSKRVFQHFYKEYQALGIERITVHANIDVGGYTWARYGFSRKVEDLRGWLDFKSRRHMDSNLAAEAHKAVAEWVKENPKKPFPMNRLAEIKGMKEELLGTSWHGEIDLTDKVQREVFENYLSGKK